MQNPPDTNTHAVPVQETERIVILDSLRGFAILGILLMNIPSFSLPGIGFDPWLLNETGVDYYTWFWVSWFPEGTQRALFSMLFGAGIILFIKGQEKKLGGLRPADYFFRRQLWLIAFSLFDVYILLWQGDILFDYACLGMLMFAFRNVPARWLLIAAGICFILMMARENRDLYLEKRMISKGEAIAKMDTTKIKLNLLQKESLEKMKDFKESSTREGRTKKMEKAMLKSRGSYEDLYTFRTQNYVDDLVEYVYFRLWDVLLFMFLGMAFFKMGILTGTAPVKVYVWMCLIGLGVGLTLSWFRLQPMIKYNFNWFDYARNVSFSYYELSRTFRAIGILGLIMLLYKSGWFKWIFGLLRPVGQMAFTNYLGQSLLCGIVFYGVGFGLYGELQRHEIYYVVAAVWIFQIILSNIWMRYFRFGPFEWLWRSLTYWKRQPFKK